MGEEVPYELNDICLIEPKKEESSLEVTVGGGLVFLVTTCAMTAGAVVASPFFLANEIAQQVKHGYYHYKDVSHERISEDNIFPYYKRV